MPGTGWSSLYICWLTGVGGTTRVQFRGKQVSVPRGSRRSYLADLKSLLLLPSMNLLVPGTSDSHMIHMLWRMLCCATVRETFRPFGPWVLAAYGSQLGPSFTLTLGSRLCLFPRGSPLPVPGWCGVQRPHPFASIWDNSAGPSQFWSSLGGPAEVSIATALQFTFSLCPILLPSVLYGSCLSACTSLLRVWAPARTDALTEPQRTSMTRICSHAAATRLEPVSMNAFPVPSFWLPPMLWFSTGMILSPRRHCQCLETWRLLLVSSGQRPGMLPNVLNT